MALLKVISGVLHWQPYDGAGFVPVYAKGLNSDAGILLGGNIGDGQLLRRSGAFISGVVDGVAIAGGTRLTGGAVSDGQILKRSGAEIISAADGVDVTGGVHLAGGAVSDGQLLKRSGTSIVGVSTDGVGCDAALQRDSAFAMTFDRAVPQAQGTPLTSGTLWLHRVYAPRAGTATKLAFATSSSAGIGITNAWTALYDSSFNLLANSADQGAFSFATNTAYAWDFAVSYGVVPGVYYVGLMIAGTSLPNFSSASGAAAPNGVTPVLCGNSNTGLTTTPPNPATALSAAGTIKIWMLLQ